jgi:hypothetical protein
VPDRYELIEPDRRVAHRCLSRPPNEPCTQYRGPSRSDRFQDENGDALLQDLLARTCAGVLVGLALLPKAQASMVPSGGL